MAKSKFRLSWDRKIEAQGGLGAAKPKVRRASGSTWGRSWGTPANFWGVRGGPPRNFGAVFFFISGEKKICTFVKNILSFRFGRNRCRIIFSTMFYDIFFPAQPAQTRLVGSRKPLYLAQFRYAPEL